MSKGPIYKSSTSSIQNAVLLLLFVIGMFVMYRYVKTIETETKLVQNHIIELTQKVHAIVANQEDCRALIATLSEGGGMGGVCQMPLNGRDMNDVSMGGNNNNPDNYYEGGEYEDEHEDEDEDEDEDEQSIKSGDITNILRKVIGDATDMVNQLPEFNQEEQPTCSLEELHEDEEELYEGDNHDNPQRDTRSEATTTVTDRGDSAKVIMNIDEDDENGRTDSNVTEEQLYRKTNDDLKGLLKEMGLSTKGAKSELVTRILSR